MNINSKSKKESTFDAIVVGTGISGGWAAKELTEGGLKTLVLERGRDVKHVKDYPTMNKNSWELPYRDQLTAKERKHYKVQSRTGYTLKQSTKHWWIKDTDQPYNEKKGSFMGNAFKLGTELVAAVAVGTIIGFILDSWFDTKPWLIIIFFFLGSAAGMLNVIKAANKMQKD